jgi:hypothetical protein
MQVHGNRQYLGVAALDGGFEAAAEAVAVLAGAAGAVVKVPEVPDVVLLQCHASCKVGHHEEQKRACVLFSLPIKTSFLASCCTGQVTQVHTKPGRISLSL